MSRVPLQPYHSPIDIMMSAALNHFGKRLPGVIITLEFLLVERLPPVVRVTLRRPQEQNRINRSMAEEIRLVFQEISGDDSASLVVLTGAGESFSVGRESPWTGPDAVDSIGAVEGSISQCQAASAVAALPVPVLVVINGDAIDQGLELALAGDIRICSQDARLGLTGVPNGEIPWDGGTQRLPRLVGPVVGPGHDPDRPYHRCITGPGDWTSKPG